MSFWKKSMAKIEELSAVILLGIYAGLIVYGTAGVLFHYQLPDTMTGLTTAVGFGFVLLHALRQMKWRKTVLLLVMTFVVSLAFESVGVATGLVYGHYHYGARLGAKFLGLVPYLIPVAWFLMVYPSYVIAKNLIPAVWMQWQRILTISGLTAVIMTAWDLAMDPMNAAWGTWVWEHKGAYFGVPIRNFWGWWLTVFVVIVLFLLFSRGRTFTGSRKFDLLVVISYAITGLSNIVIDFRIGLMGAGLAGLFAMFPWVFLGLMTTMKRKTG